jgi:hypothetical protein
MRADGGSTASGLVVAARLLAFGMMVDLKRAVVPVATRPTRELAGASATSSSCEIRV